MHIISTLSLAHVRISCIASNVPSESKSNVFSARSLALRWIQSLTHVPHGKAWYPSGVQSTFCCTIRGSIHLPPLQFHLQRHNFHCYPFYRAFEVSGLLYGIVLKCWLFMRVSHAVWHFTRPHAYTREHDIRAWAVDFTITSSGHHCCCPYLRLAEFFCKPNCILATIQSRARKCRFYLPEIVSRCRLLRPCSRSDQRVGCVERCWYEWHFHGCDIVQRWYIEMDRVEREGHEQYVCLCDTLQRWYLRVGRF